MRQVPSLRWPAFALSCAVLAGCLVSGPAFPVKMPSSKVLHEKYDALFHDLSPIPAYHFHITVPKGWQMLDTRLSHEPEGMMPEEMGAFREPGAWMEDPQGEIGGEIAVTAMARGAAGSGALRTRKWLKDLLVTNVPNVKFLQDVDSAAGAADLLMRFSAGTGAVVSRMLAVPGMEGTRVFVVTCSAPEPEYARLAEACMVAIRTFRLAVPGESEEEIGGARLELR